LKVLEFYGEKKIDRYKMKQSISIPTGSANINGDMGQNVIECGEPNGLQIWASFSPPYWARAEPFLLR
jgi:hypothetical protein